MGGGVVAWWDLRGVMPKKYGCKGEARQKNIGCKGGMFQVLQ